MDNAYIRILIFLYTSEKNSADYEIAKVLLSCYESFPNILIEDIAKQAHTTAATVTKFSHKIGYNSFKELRYGYQEEEVQCDIQNQILLAKQNPDKACDVYFQKEQDKISFYKTACNEDIIQAVAKCFVNTKQISFMYPPYAYACVHVLRNYLHSFSIDVQGIMREVDDTFMDERVQHSEVIIVINLQLKWVKTHLDQMERWKKDGKKIILITAIFDEAFVEIADVVVPFYFIGETIMDTAYQITTYLVRCVFAYANFPKLEKSK